MQHNVPCHADHFEWDEHNMGHLGEHDISPWEVEELYAGGPVWIKDKKTGQPDRYQMIGKTSDGRLLTVIVLCKHASRALRAITGWPATEGQKTHYRRRKT